MRADGREIPVDLTTAVIEAQGSPLLAVYLRDASERSERELHADARRRSAVLDLGQLALEGMGLDELLGAAVDLATEELGVDRCEVWQRVGENVLDLRASFGWLHPGTRIPLSTDNHPGYTMLRGQGAVVVEDFRREGRFDPVAPLGAAAVQSAISVRIPGDYHGFGAFVVCSHSPRNFQLAAIERVRVNDSLEQAERRVRSLIERLPSITYRAGLGVDGEWTFVSPQVQEILGYTVEEWISDPMFWETKMHPGDVDRVIAEEHRCAREGQPLDVETRIRQSNGEMIWVRDRASIGEMDGSWVMVVEGLITDVSDQKAATPAIESLRDFTDMQFVRGMLDSNADARIVESLVTIAKGLGMRTVAEGFETPAMVEPLRELGIDCGQGYLSGHPCR